MTPQEYRLKHHRCKWCKYKTLLKGAEYMGRPKPHYCLIKEKIVMNHDFFTFLNKIQGCYCGIYKPERLNFEI